MLHDISHGTPADSGGNAPAAGEQLARPEAVKQIERRRRFWVRAALGTVGLIILAVIRAFAEYRNAGGWPANGFSQSSGVPDVWNFWIIYPAIAWVGFVAADAFLVFRNKPISESEIKRDRAPGWPALTLTAGGPLVQRQPGCAARVARRDLIMVRLRHRPPSPELGDLVVGGSVSGPSRLVPHGTVAGWAIRDRAEHRRRIASVPDPCGSRSRTTSGG